MIKELLKGVASGVKKAGETLTKKARLSMEYKKTRHALLEKQRYWKKKGVENLRPVPKIPKRITEGSIRRLQNENKKMLDNATLTVEGQTYEGEYQIKEYQRQEGQKKKRQEEQKKIIDDFFVNFEDDKKEKLKDEYENFIDNSDVLNALYNETNLGEIYYGTTDINWEKIEDKVNQVLNKTEENMQDVIQNVGNDLYTTIIDNDEKFLK